MGRADHIDIEILADFDVSLDLIGRHCVAVCAAGVVMVHAVELDLSAVDKEEIALDRHGFKSDLLLHAAALCLVVDIIENGLLRIPLCNFQVFESNGDHALGCLCSLTAGDTVSFDRECDIGRFDCLCTEFEPICISCLLRLRVDLENIAVIGDPEQDIAENLQRAHWFLP